MIRILPYTEKKVKEEMLNLYLYMVAVSTPFYPEDVLDSEFYYPDGKTKTHINALRKHTRPRIPEYMQLLNDYIDISGKEKAKDRQKNDALLAEALIATYFPKLHSFLYDECSNDGHVNRSNLRKLLIMPVGESIKGDARFAPITTTNDSEKKHIARVLLENVFCYEKFSNRKEIYHLVGLMGISVCPYCNRLFTTTVEKGTRQMRPQLDHFRSKSDYPFFALSLLNIVPCCGVCNLLKGDRNDEILYPYDEEMGERFIFKVDSDDLTMLTGTPQNTSNLAITLEQKGEDSSAVERCKASRALFELEGVYQSHRGYVADLLFHRYIFSNEMIQDIADTYSDVFETPDEVRELLVLNRLGPERWGERPLGKLTHDVIKELDELYARTDRHED